MLWSPFSSLQVLLITFVVVFHTGAAIQTINLHIAIIHENHAPLHDSRRAELFRDHLRTQQASLLTAFNLKTTYSHTTQVANTAFLVLPFLQELLAQPLPRWTHPDWLLVCSIETRLNLTRLHALLTEQEEENAVQHEKNHLWWMGRALQDQEMTIRHHFDSPNKVAYPLLEAGILFAPSLVKKMQQAQVTSELSFRIDPIYEFSKWMQQQWNVSLTPSKGFCRREAEEAANNCVTWISDYYWHPQCSPLVNQSEILFAVKTASKFFETRIPILKATWASAVENIVYFADVEDASIPTVNCGVPNTERGHCGKLLASLHLINQNQKWKNIQFVVIADDDTLLSVERLQRLLSCYSSVPFLALGERYAYMSSQGGGYAYITGGGGMVLGMDTVRRLLVSENTLCGSDDSPDDMLLGIWLSHLRIPIVHSHLFHQARPMDYASEMVDPNYLKSVSFHKFWQVDPMRVFQHWLQEENLRANVHDEL